MRNFSINILKTVLLACVFTFVTPTENLQAGQHPSLKGACPCQQKNRNKKNKNKNCKRTEHHSHHSHHSKHNSYIKRVSESGDPQTRHRGSSSNSYDRGSSRNSF